MYGIDLSHFQGDADFIQVAKNNPKVDFAFLKATQGTGYTDPKFYTNVLGCNSAKIPCGYYHFATLNDYNVKKDSADEALYFLSVIKKALPAQLPLVLDIEVDSPKIQLDKVSVLVWIQIFFKTLEDNGYKNYALYSGTPFLDSHLPKNHGLENIKLWLAAYTSKAVPNLPYNWKEFFIWQYTDKGKIMGINGNVDLNRTIKDIY